jgi:hypothetical protein
MSSGELSNAEIPISPIAFSPLTPDPWRGKLNFDVQPAPSSPSPSRARRESEGVELS